MKWLFLKKLLCCKTIFYYLKQYFFERLSIRSIWLLIFKTFFFPWKHIFWHVGFNKMKEEKGMVSSNLLNKSTRIFFEKYTATNFKVGKEEFHIMRGGRSFWGIAWFLTWQEVVYLLKLTRTVCISFASNEGRRLYRKLHIYIFMAASCLMSTSCLWKLNKFAFFVGWKGRDRMQDVQ